MELERRDTVVQPIEQNNPKRKDSVQKAKPYCISKKLVLEAFERVKANKGAPGVDGETIEAFEFNLKNNLYKIWNRMSSGSYFPPPVRAVEIPKADGTKRVLGIPTVSDRVAQTVVKMLLEPMVEPKFHQDSYGYRPGKSAHDALATARERCWKFNWVIDMDIRAFFDSLDHDLMMKAVRYHCPEPWVSLYVARWLQAPLKKGEELVTRSKGTPQGGVISPLLANIFLHHALDEWMKKFHPSAPFERYADDLLIHCRSLQEAEQLLEAIKARLSGLGLQLHPEKTRIVYCKDVNRQGRHDHEKFDFLGFTFRPRVAMGRRNQTFVSFSPAISGRAVKKIQQEIRHWKLGRRSDKTLEDLARMINAKVRGWLQYYAKFNRSKLRPVLREIELDLRAWATRKYKKLRRRTHKAFLWLQQIARRQPKLFAHWEAMPQPTVA